MSTEVLAQELEELAEYLRTEALRARKIGFTKTADRFDHRAEVVTQAIAFLVNRQRKLSDLKPGDVL